jgi:hypothetical protein
LRFDPAVHNVENFSEGAEPKIGYKAVDRCARFDEKPYYGVVCSTGQDDGP